VECFIPVVSHKKISCAKKFLLRVNEVYIFLPPRWQIRNKILRTCRVDKKYYKNNKWDNGTGQIWTGDLALQICVSFPTLWTIPSPWVKYL